RGSAHRAKGELDKAVSDWKEALKHSPDHVAANNALAWLRATSPRETTRNGAEAVRHALKACERTGYKDRVYLQTLAAAYAEAQQCEKAVQWQKQVIGLTDLSDADRQIARERLKLYEAGKPLRETK